MGGHKHTHTHTYTRSVSKRVIKGSEGVGVGGAGREGWMDGWMDGKDKEGHMKCISDGC